MAKACIVCSEPGVRDSVDRQLAEGVSIRDIATVVNRSKSAIGRHKQHGPDERDSRGVKLPTPKAPRKKSAQSPARADDSLESQTGQPGPRSRDDLVARFEQLRTEALAIMREARRRGDNRLALAALKAAQELDVSSGRVLGHLAGDGATINIDARRQSIELLQGLSEDELRRLAALPLGTEALPAIETAVAAAVTT